ncbi:MAG: BON domain-containing protein [Candidatus Anaerobiospirillum pullicola]|uniref:BON domain-containing protein n=1 Tax=Candidatus Anaerobiospirillum pullicola TaxID=2838451 RepID=A0A948TI98_9GAMM|nr:BON domain-containing protein [Candidatus Anaerobiospirillum pullicola]
MRKSATALALKKAILVGTVACALPVMLNGCGALLVAGGAGGVAASQDSRGFSTMLYDETLEQESYKILKNNTLLSQPEEMHVTITAFNGNVLLTGQSVNRDYIKWVVKQIEQLEHVRKVYNYVTLQKPVPASVTSHDAWITSKVKSQLLFGKGIDSNNIKVVTENGKVFLMGIVTHDAANRAINTTLGVDGVLRVYHIFDYVSTTPGNEGTADERLNVTPVKGKKSDYYNQAPQGNTNYGESNPAVYGQSLPPVQGRTVTGTNDSTYVPPVQSQQNGGAYIIEDTPVTEPLVTPGTPGALVY